MREGWCLLQGLITAAGRCVPWTFQRQGGVRTPDVNPLLIRDMMSSRRSCRSTAGERSAQSSGSGERFQIRHRQWSCSRCWSLHRIRLDDYGTSTAEPAREPEERELCRLEAPTQLLWSFEALVAVGPPEPVGGERNPSRMSEVQVVMGKVGCISDGCCSQTGCSLKSYVRGAQSVGQLEPAGGSRQHLPPNRCAKTN